MFNISLLYTSLYVYTSLICITYSPVARATPAVHCQRRQVPGCIMQASSFVRDMARLNSGITPVYLTRMIHRVRTHR